MKILVFKICSAYSKQMNYPAASYGVPVRPLADQSENLVRPRGAGNLPTGGLKILPAVINPVNTKPNPNLPPPRLCVKSSESSQIKKGSKT